KGGGVGAVRPVGLRPGRSCCRHRGTRWRDRGGRLPAGMARFTHPANRSAALRIGGSMENLLRELRHAARALSKRPGFTLIAVFTLALGIGATTAIFSVVNAVLLEPLPYPEPGKLVRLWEVNADGGTGRWGAPNFLDLRDRSESLEEMAAYGSSSATVIGRGDAMRIGGSWVSEGFFETLRARFAIGRGFLPEESRNDARVVVIGHGFWQREFGG